MFNASETFQTCLAEFLNTSLPHSEVEKENLGSGSQETQHLYFYFY